MEYNQIKALKFYGTPESPCSYLPDQISSSVFVDPSAQLDTSTFHQLHLLGFRRSGGHVYMPWCTHCDACQSLRVLVDDFALSRNQKRLLAKNQDLTVAWEAVSRSDASAEIERYALYARYIELRHKDGDMYPPTEEQYVDFLTTSIDDIDSRFLCFRLQGKLVAVCTIDILPDGPSAIYTYFEPDLADRSLGKLAIVWLIQWAKRQKLPYVYLGYWVKGCQKMAYKIDYQPLELLIDRNWVTYELIDE